MVEQGEVYWVDLGPPYGSEPGFRRPVVIIQNDTVNATTIQTVLTCSITSNMTRLRGRGNLLLDPGEGGLPLASVVNVSQVITLDKTRLTEYSGRLSRARVLEVLEGLQTITEPRFEPISNG